MSLLFFRIDSFTRDLEFDEIRIVKDRFDKGVYMLKDLWARAGITFHLTDDEAKTLLSEEEDNIWGKERIIKKIVSDGRFTIDGECYSPGRSVEDFNQKYGTSYCVQDYDFCC